MTVTASVNQVIGHKGLSFERLRSFCAIIEAGSMVEAADGDAVLQSQFSRQIKELQQTLGVDLFIKDGKYLRPTAAGRKMAVLTNGYFAALAELRASATGEAPILYVGAGESIFRWIVFPVLPEVLSAAGRVTLEFRNHRTSDIVDRIRTGRLDIGIIRADAVDDTFAALPFVSLEYALVVPRALLPEKSAAGIQHLGKLPVAVLASEGQFVQSATELALRNGLKLDVRMRAESFSLLVESLQSIDLAAFVPKRSLKEFSSERFAVIELDGIERLTRPLRVVYDPRAAAMRDNIKGMATKLSRVLRG